MDVTLEKSPNCLRNTLLRVSVPTATAILHPIDDPWKVLVGRSVKHIGLVLPGGKIETTDLVSTSIDEASKRCIVRELGEEVRLKEVELKLAHVRYASKSDVRIVKAKSLRGTLVDSLIEHLTDDEFVEAHYGLPDFIFIGGVSPRDVHESSELIELEWFDLRIGNFEIITSGHQEVLKKYRDVIGST